MGTIAFDIRFTSWIIYIKRELRRGIFVFRGLKLPLKAMRILWGTSMPYTY